MNDYMILHYGFKKPSPGEMNLWREWFESIADEQTDRGGFREGREITASGTKEIPFGEDSITGYTIIKAENLDEAEKIAGDCPIVSSTRVYEIKR